MNVGSPHLRAHPTQSGFSLPVPTTQPIYSNLAGAGIDWDMIEADLGARLDWHGVVEIHAPTGLARGYYLNSKFNSGVLTSGNDQRPCDTSTLRSMTIQIGARLSIYALGSDLVRLSIASSGWALLREGRAIEDFHAWAAELEANRGSGALEVSVLSGRRGVLAFEFGARSLTAFQALTSLSFDETALEWLNALAGRPDARVRWFGSVETAASMGLETMELPPISVRVSTPTVAPILGTPILKTPILKTSILAPQAVRDPEVNAEPAPVAKLEEIEELTAPEPTVALEETNSAEVMGEPTLDSNEMFDEDSNDLDDALLELAEALSLDRASVERSTGTAPAAPASGAAASVTPASVAPASIAPASITPASVAAARATPALAVSTLFTPIVPLEPTVPAALESVALESAAIPVPRVIEEPTEITWVMVTAAWSELLAFTERRTDAARGKETFDRAWRESCLALAERYPELDPFLSDVKYFDGSLTIRTQTASVLEALVAAYGRSLARLGIPVEALEGLVQPIRDRHRAAWTAAGLESIWRR
jgi:hypothetical protein